MHNEVFTFDAGDLCPANGIFPNGLHEAAICFDLPKSCPSSMLFNNPSIKERPLIAITYQVSANVLTHEMIRNYGNKDYDSSNVQNWGCDKMFMVREAPVVINELTLDPLQNTNV